MPFVYRLVRCSECPGLRRTRLRLSSSKSTLPKDCEKLSPKTIETPIRKGQNEYVV